MRYVYAHLGPGWAVTILAADVQESEALREDAELLGAELILLPSTPGGFLGGIFAVLRQRRHDLIQSHGFTSAIATCVANVPFGVPHVLTVHGILEGRLLQGVGGKFRRIATTAAIRSVDAVYGVSEDILEHLRQDVPELIGSRIRQVVILNGIDPGVFLEKGRPGEFRDKNGIAKDIFLFGFLGRFMPQKGFDKIISALSILEKRATNRDYRIVAVGSGDCRARYEKMIQEKGIEHRIIFLPFQRNISEIYRDLDAVVMPSNWEACPLQPMEAMISGVPLISSDCMGLREVVRGTPAVVVPDCDHLGLALAMDDLMVHDRRSEFSEFRKEAVKRFDVRQTAKKVKILFEAVMSK